MVDKKQIIRRSQTILSNEILVLTAVGVAVGSLG